MKTSIFFALALCLMFSCNENETSIPSASDRLVFKTMSDYDVTYAKLAKFESEDELLHWCITQKHSNQLNTTDPNLKNFSPALKTILNKDSEFQLGEKVIWFNVDNETLYSFSKDELLNLKTLKETPEKCNVFGHITTSKVNDSENSGGRTNCVSYSPTHVSIYNGLDARNQFQFQLHGYSTDCSSSLPRGGTRKYVHEIYSENTSTNPGPVNHSRLYLRLKLNWSSGSGWHDADERRYIDGIVHYTVYIANSGQFVSPVMTLTLHSACYSGYYTALLGDAYTGPLYDGSPTWVLSMSGNITEYVIGDSPSNLWNDTESTYGCGFGYLF